MINKIWGFLIIVGILFCLFSNKIDIVNKQILSSTFTSFDMIIKIFPVMALWLGIMNIASKSGLLKKMAHFLTPILKKIFPEIPAGHESFSYISSNIIANMFGLGNAATPFGLKAMNSLQSINVKKNTASKSMITFLVLNTCGLVIVPTTVISLRVMHNSVNPTSIIAVCFLSSLIATIAGLLLNYFLGKKEHV